MARASLGQEYVMPARLLIIDEHDAVREALEARLNADAGLEVVACTGCWQTGLEAAEKLRPDVVLLETKRADGEGLEVLRCLTEQCPDTSVVVLTSYPDAGEQAEALEMGAARYVLKDIDTPQLVREIQAAVFA
jgi:DNA-binding NarL/FixJ family response regulator